ncbi:MAG: RNA 3'-terminal phosphate cyclase [Thermoproteota archaeon]
MIEIDGSQKSGSGTILRLSVAMSAITGQPLHLFNIRDDRPQPGLKPQHLESVLTAARLCNAELKNAQLRSREIWFNPKNIPGGNFESEIGTAGSIPMLLITVIPLCIVAEDTVHLHVTKGGTDVRHSPTINYMRYVFLPTLKRMEINATSQVHRYGYYPKGGGEVTLTVDPCESLHPLRLTDFGKIETVNGVSVCTFLAERNVAKRQAKAAENYLTQKGYSPDIQVVNDESNPIQKGSSLALWAETDAGVILGADAIGERKKRSEKVGKEAARKLFSELFSRPTVDTHMADLLIPYVALAEGESEYLIRKVTDHLETNIWLAEKLLDVKFKIEKVDKLYKVKKTS